MPLYDDLEWRLGEQIYIAMMRDIWDTIAEERLEQEPWPNWRDAKTRRTYSHNPRARVDMCLEIGRHLIREGWIVGTVAISGGR